MTAVELSSNSIAQALHPVFDEQIFNYGAYNLIFATGSAFYPNPDVSDLQQEGQQYFIVGYRESPLEAIIAPLALPHASSAGSPTSIDSTNALQVSQEDDSRFILQSTNGTIFNLVIEPRAEVVLDAGRGLLEQEEDVADFRRVIVEAWQI